MCGKTMSMGMGRMVGILIRAFPPGLMGASEARGQTVKVPVALVMVTVLGVLFLGLGVKLTRRGLNLSSIQCPPIARRYLRLMLRTYTPRMRATRWRQIHSTRASGLR